MTSPLQMSSGYIKQDYILEADFKKLDHLAVILLFDRLLALKTVNASM